MTTAASKRERKRRQQRYRRLRVLARDGFRCVWCDCNLAEEVFGTVDHLIPRARGGTNEDWNLVSSCKTCNGARGSLPAWIWLEACLAVGRTVQVERVKTALALVRENLPTVDPLDRGWLLEHGESFHV